MLVDEVADKETQLDIHISVIIPTVEVEVVTIVPKFTEDQDITYHIALGGFKVSQIWLLDCYSRCHVLSQ